MPRIVRSILTYQNNLNTNLNSNSEPNLQSNQNQNQNQNQNKDNDKKTFYTLGIRTQQKNKMSMTHSYSTPTNYLPEPVISEYDTPKYHANAKYGASKYICTLQSGKMHKLIHNNS